jgi:hypothetical protein
MPQALPSLALLSLNERRQEACPVGASWQWDANTYQVRFSVDTAILEQINGLGEMDGGDFKPTATPLPRSQMVPLNVLRAVREYTIQRLWDLECRVPWLDLGERNPQKPDQPPNDNNEPFPDTGPGLVREVAKWVLAVIDTQSPDQAKASAARRVRDRSRAAAGSSDSAVDVEDEGEAEEEEDDDEDPDTDYERRLSDKEAEIKARIRTEQAAVRRSMESLKVTLLEVEELYRDALEVLELDGESAENLPAEMELRISTYLVSNGLGLTVPSMADCRLQPERGYYDPRYTPAEKYLRWVKIQTSLSDGTQPLLSGNGFVPADTLYGIPVTHTAAVPSSLDGSFYSGVINYDMKSAEDRLDDMQMDHVVPRSHMKNCRLIKELGMPDDMAMNTVVTTKQDNTRKGNKMLPLGYTERNHREMRGNTAVVVNAFGSSFAMERRMAAARIVCATYMQLFLLERNPDPNTELGPRRGGLYYSYKDDIFLLMARVPTPGVTADKLYAKKRTLTDAEASKRLEYRQSWLWEAGIPLLQWFYLNQPYNPIPNIMYRVSAGRKQDTTMLDFFYRDLITRRFGGFDTLSEMFRREMQEEVPEAPLPLRDEAEVNEITIRRQRALEALRRQVPRAVPNRAAAPNRRRRRGAS